MNGIYIPGIDCKDIVLANQLDPMNGYNLKLPDGTWKITRFTNTLDQSLDLMKMREVYDQVYGDQNFSFMQDGKEYSDMVVCLTWKYSVKRFNKMKPNYFVRFGYAVRDDDYEDCICMKDGQVVGVITNHPVSKFVDVDLLDKCFIIKDDHYEIKTNVPIISGVADLRREVYEKGFVLNGHKFVRYKRSSGSARTGRCLFIDERLYEPMMEWSMMGLDIKEGDEVDLAGLESYLSLVSSSIVDTVVIRPEEILLIDDYESEFEDEVLLTDEVDGKLRTRRMTTTISNSLWDGQSLVDTSLFPWKPTQDGEPPEQYSMMLLRNRFAKSAGFNTNIQKFFADHGITSVEQLNGKTRATSLSQIKLITTPNSVKYLKFGSFDQWLDNLEPTWGIVKHEKKPKFMHGLLTQCHYQLLNSLRMSKEEVEQFLEPTVEYIKALRHQPEVLKHHIGYPEEYHKCSFDCKNDAAFYLMGICSDFCQSQVYYDFMRNFISSYTKNTRAGHVLINGNYEVMFGNPMEMLLQAIGRFDGTSIMPIGSVHTCRFPYGRTILGSRSPHICSGNVLLAENVSSDELDTYFNLNSEIICINIIGFNILQKMNGSDQDGDTCMLTDNIHLIQAAQKDYGKFLVPTCAVAASKKKLHYTAADKADLDIRTATNAIGVIVNLSQQLNSEMFHMLNTGRPFEDCEEIYSDISKLAVLSGLAIDAAKRSFNININREVAEIKKKYFPKVSGEKAKKPNFMGHVARQKGYYDSTKNNYIFYESTMDYVQKVMNKLRLPKASELEQRKLKDTIASCVDYDSTLVNRHQKAAIMQRIADYEDFQRRMWAQYKDVPNVIKHQWRIERENEIINYLATLKINPHTAVSLLNVVDKKDKPYLLYWLVASKNPILQQIVDSKKAPMPKLIMDDTGNTEYYGLRFRLE